MDGNSLNDLKRNEKDKFYYHSRGCNICGRL